MSSTVVINSQFQIEIPEPVREALNIGPGDELVVEVDGVRVVMQRKPGSYAKRLRGLHKEVWGSVDATEYVKKEREAWDRP